MSNQSGRILSGIRYVAFSMVIWSSAVPRNHFVIHKAGNQVSGLSRATADPFDRMQSQRKWFRLSLSAIRSNSGRILALGGFHLTRNRVLSRSCGENRARGFCR